MAKIGIVRFLGTNCDRDIWQAVSEVGGEPEWLWYENQFDEQDYKALVLPGGFSYGDYLRSGALAAKAPVMQSVVRAAKKGTPILGICNGFQVLCEIGLLPGTLLKNTGTRFIDDWVSLKMAHANPHWGADAVDNGSIPVAHGDGRYFVSDDQLKQIQDEQQIWLRYSENPNGSVMDIAGVMNAQKNVAGLMPHPERAMYNWMGSDAGKVYFESIAKG